MAKGAHRKSGGKGKRSYFKLGKRNLSPVEQQERARKPKRGGYRR